MIGDVVRPKSFAGLFGAAPSIALATIGLTIVENGTHYAGIEARSMILGAVGLFVYTSCVSWLLMRFKPASLIVTVSLMPIWLASSLGLWYLLARTLWAE